MTCPDSSVDDRHNRAAGSGADVPGVGEAPFRGVALSPRSPLNPPIGCQVLRRPSAERIVSHSCDTEGAANVIRLEEAHGGLAQNSPMLRRSKGRVADGSKSTPISWGRRRSIVPLARYRPDFSSPGMLSENPTSTSPST
jgi:hypothetical protein